MTSKFQMDAVSPAPAKHHFLWSKNGEAILEIACPVVVESMSASNPNCPHGDRTDFSYDNIQKCSDGYTAECGFTAANGAKGLVTDRWTIISDVMFTVRRSVVIEAAPPAAGLRFGLHLQPAFPEGVDFNDLQYYAPNACYNLNDLNEDGVCDYLDSQVLSYRDDRLNALSVLAYHPQRQLALSLSRIDTPKYDDEPIRRNGQLAFLQDTDIGALGFQPGGSAINNAVLTAHYPFVERDRCNALLVQDRVPWGAFRPVYAGDSFSVAYAIRLYHSSSPHDALWTLIKEQIGVLCPKPVCLDRPLDEISRLRLETLAQYFKEDPSGGAGFVTNCHPQNGQQLGNIVQYGMCIGKTKRSSVDTLRFHRPEYSQRSQHIACADFLAVGPPASRQGD